jgi:hypothetical protein
MTSSMFLDRINQDYLDLYFYFSFPEGKEKPAIPPLGGKGALDFSLPCSHEIGFPLPIGPIPFSMKNVGFCLSSGKAKMIYPDHPENPV